MEPAPAASAPPPVVPDQLRPVLEAGVWGPTGDNCQPWRLRRLRDDGFELWHDAARAASIFDLDDLASRMALGAFLENATLAAAARGRALEVAFDPEPATPALWARVALTSCAPTTSDLVEAIPRRATNRLRYEGAPLAAAAVAALRQEATPTARVHVVTDPARLAALARMVETADLVRIGCRTAHEDLQRWFRWTAAEAERTRDGLDVRTLGVTRGEQRLLHFLRPWSRMRFGSLLGMSRVMARYTRRLMEQIGGAVLLTTSAVSPRAAVEVGRVMERVWLRATCLELAVAPMAALPLFLLHVTSRGGAEFGPRHAARLRPLAAQLRALLELGDDEHALMLLRVGRAPQPPVAALRRPLEDLIDA